MEYTFAMFGLADGAGQVLTHVKCKDMLAMEMQLQAWSVSTVTKEMCE